MNRKKNFLLILLALVLTFTLTFSLFACKRDTGSDVVVDDSNSLIANGSFINADGEYPKAPASWTGSAGSTDSNKGTPSVQGQDIMTGVIDVDQKTYKEHAEEWKLAGVDNPGTANAKDNNILMINNLVDTAYRYRSSSVNIEKNSYYEVVVNVKTTDDAKAFIYVTGDAYAEFKNINNSGWKSYTLYVEGATDSSRAIYLDVANGWGDKVNGTMSKGAVFFDEISVTKLDDATKYNAAKVDNDDTTQTYSMKQSDTGFDYTSGATMPYSPAKYRGYAGFSTSGDNAYSNSTYVSHGVISTEISAEVAGEIDINKDIITSSTGAANDKMLFIHNKKKTAYGYRASVPYILEAGKSYKFSAKVRTVDVADTLNATIKFVEGSSDLDSKVVKSFNTRGEWTDITFTINGNQLSDKSVYVELWLGLGGMQDKDKWVQGTVFMDNLSFEEVASVPTADFSYADVIDDKKNMIDNGFEMSDVVGNGWDKMPDLEFDNASIAKHEVVKLENKDLPSSNGISFTNKVGNVVNLDSAVKISITEPSAYGFVIKNGPSSNKLTVSKNSYYKISMWVKTDLAEEYDAMGLNISLMQKSNKEDVDDKNVASFNNINTRQVETNNGYVNVVFYVEGAQADDLGAFTNELYVNVMLGSGTKYTAETHLSGNAFITLVSMEPVSHNDYLKASTSTYVKKNSIGVASNETATIANTNFNDSDINTTYDNYFNYQGQAVKDMTDEEKLARFMANGSFTRPTAPSSWGLARNVSKSYLEALSTGIVSNEEQLNSIFSNNTYIDKASIGGNLENFLGVDNKSALVIATQTTNSLDNGVLTTPTSPETCGCTHCKDICDGKSCPEGCQCLHKAKSGVKPFGYSSPSISLSSNSYYMISIQVKVGKVKDAEGNDISSNATVYLDNQHYIEVGYTDNAWQTVTFFVNTGLSSTSVNLEVFLGNKDNTDTINGVVAFDNAMFRQIKEEDYEAAIKSSYVDIASYLEDEFNIDNPSDEGLTKPSSDWSGAKLGSDSSDKAADLVSGIFDKDHTNRSWLMTTNTEGVTTILDNELYNRFMLDDNKNFLVINNVTPNAYSYTNSGSSKMFGINKYYQVSVNVLTFGLKASETAHITLKLNNKTYVFDNDDAKSIKVNTSTYDEDGKETAGWWTTYTFYVKTPDKTAVDNVQIKLGLGKETDDSEVKNKYFVQGYAFFDKVKFEEIYKDIETEEAKKAAFDALTENGTTMKIAVTNEELLETPAEDKPAEEAEAPKNNLMWLYITSGVIGGLIIIVVIVFVLRKFWPQITAKFNKNGGKNLSDYDKNNTAKDSNKGKKSNKEFKD